MPLTKWFAGPWGGLLHDVLLSPRCLDRGYYHPDAVRRVVTDHVQQRMDREQGIWLMLALEIWHRLFVDDDGSEAAVDWVRTDFAGSLRSLGAATVSLRPRMSSIVAAMARHRVVVFGPALDTLSGVSTHVRVLLASDLPRDYKLLHFQVGSEGRRENAAQKLLRFIVSPFHLAFFLLRTRARVVHLNASLDPKGYSPALAPPIPKANH